MWDNSDLKTIFVTLETVSDTPFIEIDPFSTINFLYFLFNEKLTYQDLSIILMLLTETVVSTCP